MFTIRKEWQHKNHEKSEIAEEQNEARVFEPFFELSYMDVQYVCVHGATDEVAMAPVSPPFRPTCVCNDPAIIITLCRFFIFEYIFHDSTHHNQYSEQQVYGSNTSFLEAEQGCFASSHEYHKVFASQQ